MTTNKKLVVTVCVMAVALILALTGIIVVLVTANQRANSTVNIKFTSTEVEVTLSATAYIGANSYEFTKGGVVGGETELHLSPSNAEGSLSQTNDIASFDLTKTNNYMVFEYVFQNKTGNIDVKIDQDAIPATKENINLTYTYSDIQITNFNMLENNTEFMAQLLPAYTGEETVKYVYIKAEIADLLYDSSLVGDFGWALSKPQTNEITTITLDTSTADYVEREGSNLSTTEVASSYEYKTFATSVDYHDINLYPSRINKAQDLTWVRESYVEGNTIQYEDVALGMSTGSVIKPYYKNSSIPVANLSVSNGSAVVSSSFSATGTEFVVPDIVELSVGGVAGIYKVNSLGMALVDASASTSLHIGRYWTRLNSAAFVRGCGFTYLSIPKTVEVFEGSVFANCQALTNVTFAPDARVSVIEGSAFNSCSNLTTIDLPKSLTTLYPNSFTSCSSLTSLHIPEGVVNIPCENNEYSSPLYGSSSVTTITVSENNPVYDSRYNCNAIIETATNTLIAGCKTTVIPYGVETIAPNAFGGMGLTGEVVLPNSVKTISKYAFQSNGYNAITSVTIPSSVTRIEEYAFVGCDMLTTVTFETTTGWLLSTDGTVNGVTGEIGVTNQTQNAIWLSDPSSEYSEYCWVHSSIL